MPLTLRPWASSDLLSLVHFANNPEIAKYLRDVFPHPYTAADGHAYLAFVASQPTGRIFAIDVDGQAVGSIELQLQSDVHCKNAEVGYWLAQPFWNKGISTQAVRQVVDYGFQTFNITRIFARPFGTNSASQRVLEKRASYWKPNSPRRCLRMASFWMNGCMRYGVKTTR
jgi:ribosomal-protein-alanine N-acetyltransferase